MQGVTFNLVDEGSRTFLSTLTCFMLFTVLYENRKARNESIY